MRTPQLSEPVGGEPVTVRPQRKAFTQDYGTKELAMMISVSSYYLPEAAARLRTVYRSQPCRRLGWVVRRNEKHHRQLFGAVVLRKGFALRSRRHGVVPASTSPRHSCAPNATLRHAARPPT